MDHLLVSSTSYHPHFKQYDLFGTSWTLLLNEILTEIQVLTIHPHKLTDVSCMSSYAASATETCPFQESNQPWNSVTMILNFYAVLMFLVPHKCQQISEKFSSVRS